MNATVAALRFVFGAFAALILVAVASFVFLVPFWFGATFVLGVGVLAVAFGDAFLTGLLRVFKWLP